MPVLGDLLCTRFGGGLGVGTAGWRGGSLGHVQEQHRFTRLGCFRYIWGVCFVATAPVRAGAGVRVCLVPSSR